MFDSLMSPSDVGVDQAEWKVLYSVEATWPLECSDYSGRGRSDLALLPQILWEYEHFRARLSNSRAAFLRSCPSRRPFQRLVKPHYRTLPGGHGTCPCFLPRTTTLTLCVQNFHVRVSMGECAWRTLISFTISSTSSPTTASHDLCTHLSSYACLRCLSTNRTFTPHTSNDP